MSVRRGFIPRRRTRPRREDAGDAGEADGVELNTFFRDALTIERSQNCCDLNSIDQRIVLARMCWLNLPVVGGESLQTQNTNLTAILEQIVRNKYRPSDPDRYTFQQNMQIELMLGNLVRVQNQKNMPLLCARLSVAAYRYQLPYNMWRLIHILAPGVLASIPWTQEFMHLATELRPPCQYPVLKGVAGVMFDNYQRRCQYKSQATVDSAGLLLGMTNWATMSIPSCVAPPNFDAAANCAYVAKHPSCM